MKTIRERGKARLELISGAAMREEAIALDHGNRKPGRSRYNWREARVTASDMIGGALRHIAEFNDGRDRDPESGAHVLAHARARLGIVLDAIAAGTLIDDRVKLPKNEGLTIDKMRAALAALDANNAWEPAPAYGRGPASMIFESGPMVAREIVRSRKKWTLKTRPKPAKRRKSKTRRKR